MLSLDFKAHRKKLADKLKPGSMAIIPSAREKTRNSDVDYPFRQNSHFFYLTGFDEPDAVAVITKDLSGEVKYILFNRTKNPEMEIWTGARAGQVGAREQFGADQAFAIDDLDKELPKLMLGKKRVLFPWEKDDKTFKKVKKWRNMTHAINTDHRDVPIKNIDLKSILNELRLHKNEAEVMCLAQAAEISAQAHFQLMQACRPGMYEYQLEALHDGFVRASGCNALAYPSIVAAGKNACTLHYVENNAQIQDGDLVLIDAAGEFKQYAGDITRTFPANGRFNDEQRAIYELVLKAQLAGIAMVKPGVTFKQIDTVILETLVAGLIELELLSGSVVENIESKAYRTFYPHGFGHWLGQDVHDVGDYWVNGDSRVLKKNMAFTIEPGLYIQPDNKDVPAKWRGIGVRIEDDILVTESGARVLSSAVPKTVAEIEGLMAQEATPSFLPMYRASMAASSSGARTQPITSPVAPIDDSKDKHSQLTHS